MLCKYSISGIAFASQHMNKLLVMAHSDIFLTFLGVAIIFISLAIVLMGLGELVKWFSKKTEQHNGGDLSIGKRKLHTIK